MEPYCIKGGHTQGIDLSVEGCPTTQCTNPTRGLHLAEWIVCKPPGASVFLWRPFLRGLYFVHYRVARERGQCRRHLEKQIRAFLQSLLGRITGFE